MKKYLLIPVFILLCVSLSAQKLSVSDFNHHPEIIVTKPPYDSNGNICSLLEINTPGINEEQRMKFRFEADAATQIVETSYPDGIIRVWLSPEAFSLVIIHRDYGRKVYEFPVIMKSKNVYSMNVSYSDTEDEKSVGWLLIDSQPESGADVYLNDEHKGVTPLSLKVDYGRYFIRVEKPFYYKSNDVIDVNKTEGNEKILIMKPRHGFIKVTTTPTNAEVIIDDMIVLKSPCTTDKLASGEHNVKVRYDNYKPYNQKVNVNDGETCELNVNLIPSFAEITIANSTGGDIYVDGIKKGTDSVTLELGEGYHDIEARATSHKTDKQNIEIEAGKPQTFTLSPKPIFGSLDVISVPPKAAVTIDGKDCGVTPKTINGLLIGKHTVTFAFAGYASETRTITIAENVTETLNVKLSTGKDITINSEPSGANVYVDGTYLGTTPLTKQIAFGSHNLKVSLDGEEKSEAINVSEGGKSSWSFDVRKKPKGSYIVNGVTFEMVSVEGGTFTMGCTDEQGSDCFDRESPSHKVTLSDYMIGKYEVTQELWQAVMGSNPSRFKGNNLPVEQVSWNDIQEFISKLNQKTGQRFRLPTEAEWEFAARGGNMSKGYKYSGSNEIENVAWYDKNSKKKTYSVGTKSPNELGLYDMSGNVYEWCQDLNGGYSVIIQTNPTGSSSGLDRVLRGGCWKSSAKRCRLSYRGDYHQYSRYSYFGFRLALSE